MSNIDKLETVHKVLIDTVIECPHCLEEIDLVKQETFKDKLANALADIFEATKGYRQ